MASEAMRTGIEMMSIFDATDVLVSAAYNIWELEFRLQKKYALNNGIKGHQVYAVAEVKNSYDEARQAITKALELGTNELIVVAEKWHAKRSLKIFQAIAPHGLHVSVIPFQTPRFEVTLEPSTIKSFRSGFKLTWILWNKFFELLTPLILKMSK
jgi:uncharacterized SAM-binding protein YcdF (DUF218 family)